MRIKPLANLAKHQARQMMIKRAENWGALDKEVQALRSRDVETHLESAKPSVGLPRLLLPFIPRL